MSDFTDSKAGKGEVYPSGQVETTFERSEPLITPAQLRSRILFGIPLVSGMKDPRTNKAAVMDDPTIADAIDRAVAIAELETGLIIFPTSIEEKLPWDIALYRSFGFLKLMKRPVASIEGLWITPSNDISVYQIPTEWLETANLHHGQLNIVPLTLALANTSSGGGIPSGGPATAVFLALFGHAPWIPAFFKVQYTAGFSNGRLPKAVNSLVGIIAAMDILSMLAPTFGKASSASLSIDGMSQSVSNSGPQIFNLRLTDLEKQRVMLVGKLRVLYATRFVVGEV